MSENESKKPSHDAFQVESYFEEDQKKSNWIKIGIAWEHEDGKGFNLNLKAIPLDGVVVLRKPIDE